MSTTKVSADLRAIIDMAGRLEARAIDLANNEIPGGEATIALAPVGNFAIFARRREILEQRALDPEIRAPWPEDYEDPNELWTPYQLIRYWSEQTRTELDRDYDDPHWKPTLCTEAAFLHNADVLNWLWTNEEHFDEFSDDIHRARTKLENILQEGDRDRVSDDVNCLLCGTRLRRRMTTRGIEDDWWCSGCHMHLTTGQYTLAVSDQARKSFGFGQDD